MNKQRPDPIEFLFSQHEIDNKQIDDQEKQGKELEGGEVLFKITFLNESFYESFYGSVCQMQTLK